MWFRSRLRRALLLASGLALAATAAYTWLPRPSWLRTELTLQDRGPTVIQQIRSLARLETVVYNGQQILEGSKQKRPLPRWLVGDRLLFVAQGEVVAGVDLSRLDRRGVRLVGDRAVVSLPRPEVFHVRLDNRTSSVYERSTGWLNRPDPQLETLVRQRAEELLLAGALRERILDRAQRNAEREVRRLLTALGAREVTFS